MNAVVQRGKLDPQAAPGAAPDVAVSQKQLFWRQFRRHRLALVSAAVLCALAALVILAPWIAPYPFDAIDPTQFRKPPSPTHIMGTDDIGRDLFTRLLYGGRISLAIGIFSAMVGTSVGTLMGSLAGHILPTALAPIIVGATLGVGGAIIAESSLSFLGLGVQVPTPSWGNMLQDSQSTMASRPWLTIFPGMAILITVLGINFLGDGLRDALDPTIRS